MVGCDSLKVVILVRIQVPQQQGLVSNDQDPLRDGLVPDSFCTKIRSVNTVLPSIAFNYSEADKALFQNDQERHWKDIEGFYVKLRGRCVDELKLSQGGTHKAWITQRVEMHMVTSLIRLLYLTESFRDAALKFNSAAAAVHIKAMAEIPLHLGYLVWILSSHSKFEDMRAELKKIAWGIRDNKTHLTYRANITQKEFYTRADEMIEKHFKDQPSTIKIFETIYKEANATGHHNYEGRNLLIGVQKDGTWTPKDRKEWFIFLSSNIFQFFLQCATILGMTSLFVNMIDHYLAHLPERFE